jgi:ABC-type phosphate transport system substrate-binding protein
MGKEGIIMKQLRVCAVAVFLILASANVWAQAKSYKVIVNPSNPISSMSREDLSRIFLKKTTKFPDGRGASPVDLSVNSSTRENFSKDVHGKPASAVEAYWQQLIFSGRDVPPAQKSESGALDFVRSNENGIGYVSAGADTAGVKVISVTN